MRFVNLLPVLLPFPGTLNVEEFKAECQVSLEVTDSLDSTRPTANAHGKSRYEFDFIKTSITLFFLSRNVFNRLKRTRLAKVTPLMNVRRLVKTLNIL